MYNRQLLSMYEYLWLSQLQLIFSVKTTILITVGWWANTPTMPQYPLVLERLLCSPNRLFGWTYWDNVNCGPQSLSLIQFTQPVTIFPPQAIYGWDVDFIEENCVKKCAFIDEFIQIFSNFKHPWLNSKTKMCTKNMSCSVFLSIDNDEQADIFNICLIASEKDTPSRREWLIPWHRNFLKLSKCSSRFMYTMLVALM